MSKIVKLTVWIAQAEFVSGGTVASPLVFPKVTWIDEEPKALASAFAEVFQEKRLEEGEYMEALTALPDLQIAKDRLSVGFPPAEDRIAFGKLDIDFSYFCAEQSPRKDTKEKSPGFVAFVPALGIQTHGETDEELRKHLAEAIRLEFARHDRLESFRLFVETMWYSDFRAVAEQVEMEFYTPTELADIHKLKKNRLLPQVADKVSVAVRAAFCREEQVAELARSLKGKYSPGVLLRGPSGCGKSAIIHEFCRTKAARGFPGRAVWVTTAARLVQKLTAEGGWQQNLETVCEELRELGDILYVRNFAQLFEVGRYVGNQVSIGECLRNYILQGSVTLLTECTDEEAAILDLRYPGYTSLLQAVRIAEPTGEVVVEIVTSKAGVTARDKKIDLARDAVLEAVRLHRRYTPYSGFPGKPTRFLEGIVRSTPENSSLDRTDIVSAFCEETGLPRFMVDPGVPMDLGSVAEFFNSNLFGQDEAVATVVDLLASVKAAVTRQGKPIANLLFVGPTGVGKTEMAKVLAEFMFSDRGRVVRFDMSEYGDPVSVLRLTGETGSGDGLLTSAVRKQPFCVLLFDELEKAHYSFFDLLLQLLGEGRLTDSAGRTADFCSAIVIMTSNIGTATSSNEPVGFVDRPDLAGRARKHFLSEVTRHFRPELFNRLDRIVAFNPLDRAAVRRVLKREFLKIERRRGFADRNLRWSVQDSAADWLCEQGYDARYGARQLQRTVRHALLAPLAERLNVRDAELVLRASVTRGSKGLRMRIRAEPGKKPFRKVIPGLGVSMQRLTNMATARRRGAQAMSDGLFVVKLESKLDLLEKLKQEDEKAFWENREQADIYGRFLDLQHDLQEAFCRAENLEADVLMGYLGHASPSRELLDKMEGWKQDYAALKIRLYQALVENADRCVIGVYGANLFLREMGDIYSRVARGRDFDCVVRQVQTDGLITNWSAQPESRQKTSVRLSGIEMSINGPCASLFFEAEEGFHSWKPREDVKEKYAVLVENCPPEAYRAPAGIHRKEFFKKKPTRRTYEDEGIRDSVYGENVSGRDRSSLLYQMLDRRFERELRVRLLGVDGRGS